MRDKKGWFVVFLCIYCVWNTNISHVLTESWGSADLGRRPRLTLIFGCCSNLCEEQKRKKKKGNRRQRGRESQRETWKVKQGGRHKKPQTGLKHSVSVGGSQCMNLVIYSHPAQLLIRRKGPSWDHLDGVLLQSSGTKHTHRPLRSDINIPLSRSYLCCILDCCSFPGWGRLTKGNISR